MSLIFDHWFEDEPADVTKEEVISLQRENEELKKRTKELEDKLEELYQNKIDECQESIDKLKYLLEHGTNILPNCIHCSNHPSNGGSGICHCVMASSYEIK